MLNCDDWEGIWSLICKIIKDCSNNDNNRFDAAAKLNKHFKGDGPFWGNGLNHDIPCLPRKRPVEGWGKNLPLERRYAEKDVKKAQEVWKLSGAGSVGGQALTGIAALEKLRRSTAAKVWPFQPLAEDQSPCWWRSIHLS